MTSPHTTLIVARHGNTFEPGETPRRVGARSDLPLVETGKAQARAIGRYLKQNDLAPDPVYCSHLQRTRQTADIAILETGLRQPVFALDILNEIDYGPDEGRTDAEVIERIGAQALQDWDERGIVPPGWQADTAAIIAGWRAFASQISLHGSGEIVMAVTSNGIARFAPWITGSPETFLQKYKPKMATGALGIFEYDGARWTVKEWNLRPPAPQ